MDLERHRRSAPAARPASAVAATSLQAAAASARPATAPSLSYGGGSVAISWVSFDRTLEDEAAGQPGEWLVEVADDDPSLVRGDGVAWQRHGPWRATDASVLVLDRVRRVVIAGDGNVTPQEPWRTEQAWSAPLVEPRRWTRSGLAGRPVEGTSGLVMPDGVARRTERAARAGGAHATPAVREAWRLLPDEGLELADGLCRPDDGAWTGGKAWLSQAANGASATEYVAYARMSSTHVVALRAQRTRSPEPREDAADAGPWTVTAMGGPRDLGAPALGSGREKGSRRQRLLGGG